ncbi:pyruvate dehydrogenase [acetyl-transferring]-phosphatase 2, mitochondrial [Bombina bombina]|uniref:pyruvate dehydrogenase [acetyl-transferring]-phosphatase 2, mitochondrial n=1 Tax=Bombina bombina TaxID=8345 RepID=UPI00235B0C2E|nr:pyruvate dehydrogenase [acetyl-transferring]-phosphatase 2, mitochondrial [Bombina bombina]
MSRSLPGWFLGSAKESVALLKGDKRLFSRCVLSRDHTKWKRTRMGRPSIQTCFSYPEYENNVSTRKSFSSHSTEERVQFQLSPSYVNHILRVNELSYKVPEIDGKNRSTILKFDSNQLCSNNPCEDRRSAATCLQNKGHIFGVFDGHAGASCAQTISERLFYYIAVSLMPQQTLEEIEYAMEHIKPVFPILQWHKHKHDYLYREAASLYINHLRVYWQELIDLDNEAGMSVADALTYAFQRLDSDISLEAQASTEDVLIRNITLQTAFSGATACVSHVDGVHLHVANVGDCRAILGVQEESGTWSALPLTADHNAFNKSEVQRIQGEHPPSEAHTVVTDNRLLGVLMPFRAFGDFGFKWSQQLQKNVLHNACDLKPLNIYRYSPLNYLTPPYLTAKPEVTYHKLRPQDKFLVLASDGLWDMMENHEVVKLVADHLLELTFQQPEITVENRSLGYIHNLLMKRRFKRRQPSDLNVATHLIRNAIGTNECGELEQEKLVAMLSLPEDIARMYRDDITVTVVFFNSNVIEMHYREIESF